MHTHITEDSMVGHIWNLSTGRQKLPVSVGQVLGQPRLHGEKGQSPGLKREIAREQGTWFLHSSRTLGTVG